MARIFPLAGLLRLRQTQQEQTASDLAIANARAHEINSKQDRVRLALSNVSSQAASTSVLYAVAAARASSQSMLAELDALDCDHRPVLDGAARAFTEARARSTGLEKLESKHSAEVVAEELHAEQVALDEIASVGWHRRKEEGTP